MENTNTVSLDTTTLEILFNHMKDAVYLIDPISSNIVWCNRSGYEELGYEESEILNHSVLSLQKHVIGMDQWQEIANVIKTSNSYTFIGNHHHKNGGDITVEVITNHFEFQDTPYFLSVARDISKRLEHEQELKSRDHRIWFALNEASDGLWEWDINSSHVFFSPQLKKMLGYGPDEMEPTVETWSTNIHPDDLEMVMCALNQHLDGHISHYECEYRLRNRNNEYLWVHDKGKVCEYGEDGKPAVAVGMVHNISKRKELEFQLDNLASEDHLTKLPNRRGGETQAVELLQKAAHKEQHSCLAVLDLDFFKQINDEYGHHIGDKALVFVANILQDFIRSTDLVYRWGGEEFVCLFPNTTLTEIEKFTDSLHELFDNANWLELGIPKQTVSIGVASTELHSLEFAELFQHADRAVYLAKKKGRNQTVFTSKAH